MIATHGVFRIAAAVLFAAFGTAGIAQTRLSSSVPFAVVGSAASGRPASAQAADPEVFGLVPADPDPDFPYSPYAGAQLTLAGAGPQVQVTSVRLYAYALKTGVFQHISARFRFWNAYESSASPVFSKPAEFVVDLTACPCNFVAGKTYFVDVALPKPVLTESLHVGFSLVWETDAGDGTLAISSDLVPAVDASGGTTTSGAEEGVYANLGRSPDDLDFVPADAAASPGTGLGVALNGTPMTLDPCTGATNFQDQFVEEFDDAGAFFQRWKAFPNNGTFAVGAGYLALSAPDGAAQFPYVASAAQATVIPPAGNFVVRWRAVYTQVGPAGDGEMVISHGTPLNGDNGNADPASVALRSWQDLGGFYVYPNTNAGAVQIGGGAGTTVHDFAYCWVNGNVELWKDGARQFGPATQPAQRPDSIWFGNPVVAGGGPWNAVTIQRVLVRGDQATLVDHIFGDGFGPPPGHQ